MFLPLFLVVRGMHMHGALRYRFIDERQILTGSDDGTVRLWDMRKLSTGPIKVFTGNDGWVKNVEYCYGRMCLLGAWLVR
jgi:WD40 repeat protein